MSTGVLGDDSDQGQLRDLAAFASNVFTITTSFCFSFVSNATRWTFSPLTLAYPSISYLLAPFLVFAATVINVSILAPLSAARDLLNSLYPVYVFCGVACITGIMVGLGGRGISVLLTRTLATSEQEENAPMDIPEARRGERRNRRRRLRIKEEDM